MSGLFNQASLVLVPSGYKAGKVYSQVPTSGDGDLTFTRASDATRVNSDGLIERVPYNLVQYSEDFSNVYWYKDAGVTVDTNVDVAPNGTTTADRLNLPTNGAVYRSGLSFGTGSFTLSVWLKGEGANIGKQVLLACTNGNSTVTLTGDWQRFTTTGTNVISVGIKRATSGQATGVLAWGIQLVEGTTAQTYLPTTDRLNFPRLDYSQGSCPALLLEPQRTNLALYSEQFDNAYWEKENSSVTANTTTSPDGNMTADKIIPNGTVGLHRVYKTSITITSGVAYSMSVFAKKSGYDFLIIREGINGTTVNTFFDLNNGTVGTIGVGRTATIQNYGNGWFRCVVSGTSSSTNLNVMSLGVGSSNGVDVFSGDTTSGIFIWGAQLEQGAYPTSYIPTTSATVTRLADTCSKTGISSLIGQTEGTMFVEFDIPSNTENGDIIAVRVGTSSANGFFVSYRSSSVLQLIVRISSTNALIFQTLGAYPIGKNKLAVAYKNGDFAISLNGTATQVDTSTITMPTSLDSVGLFGGNMYTQTLPIQYAQVLLFPTRLEDVDCEVLTGEIYTSYSEMATALGYTII